MKNLLTSEKKVNEMLKKTEGEPYYQVLFRVDLGANDKGELYPSDLHLIDGIPLRSPELQFDPS